MYLCVYVCIYACVHVLSKRVCISVCCGLSICDSHYCIIFRYVPLDWANKKELTVEEVKKLNQHNTELVKGLLQYTDLYTSYQHGNFTCIALKSVC